MRRKTTLLPAVCIALGAVAWPAAAEQLTPRLADALQRGGHVLLLRHTNAVRFNEPSPLDLADCESQIKLTDKGREQARAIGQAFAAFKIPLGKVLSSSYCRTMETARLAFGRAESSEALLHPAYAPLPGRPQPPSFEQRTLVLKTLVATAAAPGSNTVLVTHGENIGSALGFPVSQGETVVFRPDEKGGTAFIARVVADGWTLQSQGIANAIIGEANPKTPEISTAELRKILADRSATVFDARPPLEFAISHIPGALNVAPKPGVSLSVYVSDVAEIGRILANRKDAPIVLYCAGPFCGKSRRLAEDLVAAGYTNVRRYQLGVPVWRALGGVTQIEADGIRHVRDGDKTAVFFDARSTAEFKAGSLAGARHLPREEVGKAKDDGRLPMDDHNTRIVVFGKDAAQARAVAEEIAKNAFHNVSFYAGAFADLQVARN